MQTRRLVHEAKDSFCELYWEGGELEIVSGANGTKGRARRLALGSPREVEAAIAAEVAKRIKQGFVEVTAEAPPAIQAQVAPRAAEDPALLAAIVAAPDDDAPRLVYADHLQAQGDPRGELIVVACERARLPRWDPRAKILREREEQLILTFHRRWLGDLAGELIARWERGFVDRVRVERIGRDVAARTLLDRALAIAPLLRTLALPGEILPRTVGSPAALARLAGLELRGPFYVDSLAAIAASVPAATRLAIRAAGLGRAQLVGLPRRAWRELDFHQNTLGHNGTKAILDRLEPDAIRALDLGASGVTDHGAAAIAKLALPNLTTLALRRAGLGGAGIAALAAAADLRSLARLDLSANRPSGEGVAALAGSTALPALAALDLRGEPLTREDVATLAASPLAARLEELSLASCGLDAAAIAPLLDAAWPALRFLDLGGNPLGADAIRAIRTRFASIHVGVRAAAAVQ